MRLDLRYLTTTVIADDDVSHFTMFALPLRYVRPATVFAGIAISGASYAFIRNIHADTGAPTKVFGRGPAMISLPLESSEQVNHNTKLLRFKLPNDNDISGLPLTCKCTA